MTRGAVSNPSQRFASLEVERDPDPFFDEEQLEARTRFWDDRSRSLLTENDSPDIPFEVSANPYRGCEHGCAYCYARPTHEYLGYSAGLDFETQIHVKQGAAELLREQMDKPGWKPRVVAISGVTDPYQPVERKLRVTRGILEVMLAYRNPVSLITKNYLITRDADLIGEMARLGLARATLSITTLNENMARIMEPRAATPERRLRAIEELTRAGIAVSVMAAPMIPGLTDHEIPEILRRAAEAGAVGAGFLPLRLPGNVAQVFVDWLEANFPDRKEKVLNKIRSMRGGKLNDSNFFSRFQGEGPVAQSMRQLYSLGLKRAGLAGRSALPPLRTDLFRRPGPQQLQLF